MKPMPWKAQASLLLTDPEVHVAQLVQINQPGMLRSALADTRYKARYLIRGSRGTHSNSRHFWREVVEALQAYRHNVRIYIRALNELGEPTNAQWLAQA